MSDQWSGLAMPLVLQSLPKTLFFERWLHDPWIGLVQVHMSTLVNLSWGTWVFFLMIFVWLGNPDLFSTVFLIIRDFFWPILSPPLLALKFYHKILLIGFSCCNIYNYILSVNRRKSCRPVHIKCVFWTNSNFYAFLY